MKKFVKMFSFIIAIAIVISVASVPAFADLYLTNDGGITVNYYTLEGAMNTNYSSGCAYSNIYRGLNGNPGYFGAAAIYQVTYSDNSYDSVGATTGINPFFTTGTSYSISTPTLYHNSMKTEVSLYTEHQIGLVGSIGWVGTITYYYGE